MTALAVQGGSLQKASTLAVRTGNLAESVRAFVQEMAGFEEGRLKVDPLSANNHFTVAEVDTTVGRRDRLISIQLVRTSRGGSDAGTLNVLVISSHVTEIGRVKAEVVEDFARAEAKRVLRGVRVFVGQKPTTSELKASARKKRPKTMFKVSAPKNLLKSSQRTHYL